MKKNRKYLAHRTIAPRLAELLDEAYGLLSLVHGDARFMLLLDAEHTRIVPMSKSAFEEEMAATDATVEYNVETDEEGRIIAERGNNEKDN